MPRLSRRAEHLNRARAAKIVKNDPNQSLADALADLTLSMGDHTDSEEEPAEVEEIDDISDDEDDYFAALEGLMALQASNHDSSNAIAIGSQDLKSPEPTLPGRRFVYTGNSKRTQRYRKQKLREASTGSRSILDFFATPQTKPPPLPLETCLVLISELPFMSTVQRKANYDDINVQFEIKRATAVRSYITDWLEAEKAGQDAWSGWRTESLH